MVELSGHAVTDETSSEGEIEIRITGLRPGEKLYEELLIGDDPSPTAHPRVMKAREAFRSWDDLRPWVLRLQRAAESNDIGDVRDVLQQLVTGYQPAAESVDWITASGRV
jgi:FlaA1/EpsC-like NDP-sugar epimerase